MICSVLSTWDHSIDTLSKLLHNSETQARALTQTLIWGKRRLSRFASSREVQTTTYGTIPRDWQFPRIGKLACEVSIRNTEDHDLPVLACSKYAGFVRSLEYFKKKVYSDDTSTYKVVPRGAFGFPSNHIEEGSIGYQDVCDAGLVSPIYCLFRTDGSVSDNYLYRLFKTDHYRQIFSAATNSSVDRRGSLRWHEFSKLHVPLPSLKEQEAIVSILNAADAKTANLAKQLENLRNQRVALMQQLLTGTRRMKVDTTDVPAAADRMMR